MSLRTAIPPGRSRRGLPLVLTALAALTAAGCAPATSGVAQQPAMVQVAGAASSPPGQPQRGQLEPLGSGQGELTTLSSGVILLPAPVHDPDAAATAPLPGTAGWTWPRDQPLPAPPSAGRPVDVFYTPHPDDETLSMAVLIADAVRHGDRVILVGLADGRTTGAVRAIGARLAAEHRHPTGAKVLSGPVPAASPPGTLAASPPGTPAPARLTPEQIGAARDGELRRAAADLGIQPQDVVLAHLDAPGSDHGALVTVAEAEAVIRVFAARYPGATHVTMSDVAERQQDHLDAGTALRRLASDGTITSARWTVSRLWWRLSSPAWTWVVPSTSDRERIRRAADEYLTWDPADGDYAVGYFSVRWQFAALTRDERDRVHGAGPGSPGVS